MHRLPFGHPRLKFQPSVLPVIDLGGIMIFGKLRSLVLEGAMFKISAIAVATVVSAQSPAPSPGEGSSGDAQITSSVEFGVRALKVNGDHEKFRSDLNYRSGFRLFDSSILIEDGRKQYRAFDGALIQMSGWGSDPTGSFRLNADRLGLYRLDSSVRRVRYFNNLKNHVPTWSVPVSAGSQHRANTLHHFGDLDLTLFPESDLRLRFGYGFNDTKGPGTNNLRFRSDEFQVDSRIQARADDFRAGIEGKLLGFNLGVMVGHRRFKDRTEFFVTTVNQGNNPAATTASLNTASRRFQVVGATNYGNLFFQRSVMDKLDIGGRLIYSQAESDINESDILTGRVTQTGNIVTHNEILVPGIAKRPQTRADLGVTFRPAAKIRFSNTFSFDQFSIGGANTFLEFAALTNAAGVPQPSSTTRTYSWRATSLKRFSDLVEADFQVNRRFGFNVGYRYTHRQAGVSGRDLNLISGATTRSTDEELENTTHSLIAGAKIKPTSNWSIFMDVERGESDNVFTRLANNDTFNFRVRSRTTIKNVTLNISAITKDSDNPGTSVPIFNNAGVLLFPATETIANTKSRIFSGDLDWSPTSAFSLNTGYTYIDLRSSVDVLVPIGTPIVPSTQFRLGRSEFYIRDSFFFFDVTVRPAKRLSVYASYRISDDRGQGDRVIERPEDIITSYPMRSHNPEIKLAVRVSRNVDWNLGYQYNSYRESAFVSPFATPVAVFPAQNYNAHMPYTSLRIFFGPKVSDR